MTLDLEVSRVFKRFGSTIALSDASISIKAGKISGLFGSNGAGKTTLLRIISGVTKPDFGKVVVKGLDVIHDPVNSRKLCTPIVEIPMLYKSMKLYDMLVFFCEVSNIPKDEVEERVMEALYLTGTGDILSKKFGKMSLGQQHRVEIARAICTANDILLMDEPFVGVDVDTKRVLKEHFRKWVRGEKGRSILFTSHNLMENEGFVDDLIFLSRGKVVETGPVSYFKTKYLKSRYSFEFDDLQKAVIVIQKIQGARIESIDDQKVIVSLKEEGMFKIVMKELALSDVGVLNFSKVGSVEEIFSHVMEVNQ